MQHKHKGFTLLECAVALLLMALLSLLIASVIAHIIPSLHMQSTILNTYVELMTAQFSLTKDLTYAPRDKKEWYRISLSEIVWHTMEHDYGWSIEHHKLVRSHGTYDIHSHQWHKRTRTIAADGINTATFTVNTHGNYVTTIVSVLQKNDFSVRHVHSCTNGQRLCK